MYGSPLRLQTVVRGDDGGETNAATGSADAGREAAEVAESEAAEAAGELPDAQRAYESALEALQRGLGAQVVPDS